MEPKEKQPILERVDFEHWLSITMSQVATAPECEYQAGYMQALFDMKQIIKGE